MPYYKSKFRIIGKTGLIIIVWLFNLSFLLYTTYCYNNLGSEDKLFMSLAWPCSGFLILFLGRMILVELKFISITKNRIILKNILSRRSIELDKSKLIGYKDTYSWGYKILLIDNSNKIVAKLHEYCYTDFISLRNNLELDYLGRIPTFLDKFIIVETLNDEK